MASPSRRSGTTPGFTSSSNNIPSTSLSVVLWNAPPTVLAPKCISALVCKHKLVVAVAEQTNGAVHFWENNTQAMMLARTAYVPDAVTVIVPIKRPNEQECFLCVTRDGSLFLLEAESGTCIAALPQLVSSVSVPSHACVFANGKNVALCGQNAAIEILDLSSFQIVHYLHGHHAYIDALAQRYNSAKKSAKLFSYSHDEQAVMIWDWSQDKFMGSRRVVLQWQPQSLKTNLCTPSLSCAANADVLLIVDRHGNVGYTVGFDDGTAIVGPLSTSSCCSAAFISNDCLDVILCTSTTQQVIRLLPDSSRSFEVLPVLPQTDFRFESNSNTCLSSNSSSCLVHQLVTLQDKTVIKYTWSCCRGEILQVSHLRPGGHDDSNHRRLFVGSNSAVLSGKKKTPQQQHTAIATLPIALSQSLLPTLMVFGDSMTGVVSGSFLPNIVPAPTTAVTDDNGPVSAISCPPTWWWGTHGELRLFLVGRRTGVVEVWSCDLTKFHSSPSNGGTTRCPILQRQVTSQAHHGEITGFSSPGQDSPSPLAREKHDHSYKRVFCSVSSKGDVVVFGLDANRMEGEFLELVCLHRFTGHCGLVRSIFWEDAFYLLRVRCDVTYIWNLKTGALERKVGELSDRTTSMHSYAMLPTLYPLKLDAGGPRANRFTMQSNNGTPHPLSHTNDTLFATHFPHATHVRVYVDEVVDALFKSAEVFPDCTRLQNAKSGALTLLLRWGLAPEIDVLCQRHLQLTAPVLGDGGFCEYGVESQGGVLTLARDPWKDSGQLTGLFSVVSVSSFMGGSLAFQGNGKEYVSELFSKLTSNYGVAFPDQLREQQNGWRDADLAQLARFALTDRENRHVHVASTLLMRVTTDNLSHGARVELVGMWSDRLAKMREAFVLPSVTSTTSGTGLSSSSGGMGVMNNGGGSSSNLDTFPADGGGTGDEYMAAVSSSTSAYEEKLRIQLSQPEYQLAVLILATVGSRFPGDLSPSTSRLVSEALVEMIVGGGSDTTLHDSPARQSSEIYHSTNTTTPTFALERSVSAPMPSAATSMASRIRHLPTSFMGKSTSSTTHHNAQHQNANTGCIHPTFAAELLTRNFALFRPYITYISRLIRRLLELDEDDMVPNTVGANTPPPPPPPPSSSSARNNAAVRRALVVVGAAHPVVFIRTAGMEAIRPDTSESYRARAINSIIMLVRDAPDASFVRYLPLVSEVIVKTLDPSEPALRSACFPASSRALWELVRKYPMVSFHKESQRFAVGTMESIIVIYELRTATKWRVLEGTDGPISAVAFANDGEKIASYAQHENTLRIWLTGSGGLFGGILGMRSKCVSVIALSNATGKKDGNPPEKCKVEWTKPNEVKLTRGMKEEKFVVG